MPAVSSILLGSALASSLGSGVVGALSNMSAQQRAAALQDKSVQEWLKVNVPNLAPLDLQNFVQTGKLSPQLETAVKPLNSAFDKVRQDPKLKEARLRALGALEQQGYGGEQVQDTAAREQALIESGAKNRGEQEAITSSMARRGQLGSGLELTARQGAAQADNDRNTNAALEVEKQRRNRALQSIEGAGDLAGSISNQDFQRDSAIASAKDAINLFNTKNTQDVQNRNVGRSNDAQQYNLDRSQDIANRNVGVNNYEQEFNENLAQKNFDNQVKKTAGLTGQYGQQAQQATQQGQSAANMWGGIASGAGSLGLGAAKLTKDKPLAPDSGMTESTPYAGDDEEWAKAFA